jgi:hypothetical protein
MTTNELEGRALAEAAARAMGWKKLQGSETWDDGIYLRTMDQRPITERECLAWLRQRGDIELHIGPNAMQAWHHGAERNCRYGYELGETLHRLVVAVAAREVKQ